MILGVVLSTLHQSSFGSLYLIVPNRLHPLWYSPLLPILFFISCIASGLSMVILETLILSRDGRRLLPDSLRGNLAKIVAVALASTWWSASRTWPPGGVLHLLGRPWTTTASPSTPKSWRASSPPWCCSWSRGCAPRAAACTCATLLVLVGFATNRMNTAITGMEDWPTRTYFPALPETLIMLGIAAVGFSAFSLIAGSCPSSRRSPRAAGPGAGLGREPDHRGRILEAPSRP